MIINLNNMGTTRSGQIRVDVWIEGLISGERASFVGDLTLNPEEWERLALAYDHHDLEVKVNLEVGV